jgi:hypothetical protein
MIDSELLERFEATRVRPGMFHHADHVRLAFVYLTRFDLFESLARYRRGLKRFASKAGVPEKYHETVTCALMILINERMVTGSDTDDWDEFAAANPDLMRWKDGAFFDYYGADVLDSDLARGTFVLPSPSRLPAVPSGVAQ